MTNIPTGIPAPKHPENQFTTRKHIEMTCDSVLGSNFEIHVQRYPISGFSEDPIGEVLIRYRGLRIVGTPTHDAELHWFVIREQTHVSHETTRYLAEACEIAVSLQNETQRLECL